MVLTQPRADSYIGWFQGTVVSGNGVRAIGFGSASNGTPYCRQQLVDFDTNALLLMEAGTTVVAGSVDDVETTKELFDGLKLRYVKTVAELDGPSVSDATGAVLQTGDRTFLHATGFLLNPAGEINQSCYSSGPIGRLTCNDVMKKVAFEKFMESRR